MIRRLPAIAGICLLLIVASVMAASHAYVGNTKTYKFHRLSCRYAGCTNCTAKFSTREEAIQAGYRPCGHCEP